MLPAVATEAVANVQKKANMAVIYSRQSSVLETLEEFRVARSSIILFMIILTMKRMFVQKGKYQKF